MKTFIFLALAFIGLTAWTTTEAINSVPVKEGKVVKMRVLSHRADCSDFGGLSKCCVYQMEGDIGSKEWKLLDHRITGFSYEPGYIYDLKVKVDDDKSPITYHLVSITSKRKA